MFRKTYTIVLIIALIVPFFFVSNRAEAAWYSTSWDHRVKIEINPTYVTSTLTNFPVYVDLSTLPADFHSNVNSDGGDIRVTTSDEITEVPREVVFYNSGTDTGELHFKASSISSSATTTFYIYYGNAGASDYAIDATYGAENVWTAYLGVWHLHQGNSTTTNAFVDSTSNDFDATLTDANGSVGTGTGKLGADTNLPDFPGQISDAMSTNVSVGALPDGTDTRTISFWFSSDETSTALTAPLIRYSTNGSAGQNYKLFFEDGAVSTEFNGHRSITPKTTLSTGTWYYVNSVVPAGSSSTGDVDTYINSTNQTLTDESGSAQTLNTGYANLSVAADGSIGAFLDGRIDEVRIASTDLGSNWIASEYTNQNSPLTFYYVADTPENKPVTDPSEASAAIIINNGKIKINNGKIKIN